MQPKAAEFLLAYDICSECEDTFGVSSDVLSSVSSNAAEYTVSIYTDNYAYVHNCEPHAAWQSSKIEPPSAAIKYGSPRRDFVTPRDDGDLRPRLSAAIHKTERSGNDRPDLRAPLHRGEFADMSIVDIAYEYSREIFQEGGGSCSQNA